MTQEAGSFAKSMVSDLLDKLDGMEERASQEKAIKECAATVYIGTYESISTFEDFVELIWGPLPFIIISRV